MRNKLKEMEVEGMVPTMETYANLQEGQMTWMEEMKKSNWKVQWKECEG